MGPANNIDVLVVEDESLIALDIEDILVRAGYRVRWCSSVKTALEALEAVAFDAAVVDINVQEERSTSIADALASRAIPFVVVSGHSSDILPMRHRNHPFIGKPYVAERLLGALRDILPAAGQAHPSSGGA